MTPILKNFETRIDLGVFAHERDEGINTLMDCDCDAHIITLKSNSTNNQRYLVCNNENRKLKYDIMNANFIQFLEQNQWEMEAKAKPVANEIFEDEQSPAFRRLLHIDPIGRVGPMHCKKSLALMNNGIRIDILIWNHVPSTEQIIVLKPKQEADAFMGRFYQINGEILSCK